MEKFTVLSTRQGLDPYCRIGDYANSYIDKVNELITRFNALADLPENKEHQIALLKQMQAQINKLENAKKMLQ